MTHFKNKALLDLYNHTPKHETNKNVKPMDLADNIVAKVKPLYIPEQVINPKPSIKDIGPDKYIFNNKVYNVPKNLNGYMKNGSIYPQ